MKKSAVTFVLIIFDIALLLVILLWPERTSQNVIPVLPSPPGPILEETPPVEPEVTEPVTETNTPPEPEQEETPPVEPEVTEPVPETTEPVPGTTEDETEEEFTLDVSAFDTRERPHIRDFKWVTEEIRAGICPEEAESFYFEESLGGWKCYVVESEADVERLANLELSGTEDDAELLIDWYYIRINKEEVSEDAAPDSVFKGNVTDEGELDTHGAGSLHITDIYRIDDHQYAFGKISWPDGISGSIYLVRP